MYLQSFVDHVGVPLGAAEDDALPHLEHVVQFLVPIKVGV